MKNWQRLKRSAALALTMALLLLAAPLQVLAAESLENVGTLYQSRSIPVGETAVLTQNTLDHASSGLEREQYVTFTPSSQVVPVVAYGSKLYGRSTVNTVVSGLQKQGKHVLAAANGDFFMTGTGIPIGLVVTDGVMRSSDAKQNAIGFLPDGSVVIGKPNINVYMNAGGQNTYLEFVNKTRANYSVWLYSSDYSATTRVSSKGRNVVLGSVSGPLKVGGKVTAKVEQIVDNGDPMAIPEGKLVVSAPEINVKDLSHLQVGMDVTISVDPYSSGSAWSQVTQAVGAGDLLVSNGRALSGLSNSGAAPRTAFGVKADGSCVLYTVDGRQSSYSKGLTLRGLAQRMEALGCVTAVNLDGGGSTSLSAQLPGDAGPTLLSRPSDGSLRKCANFLVLLSGAGSSGEARYLHPYPYSPLVLKGARVQMSAKATDEGYRAAAVPAGLQWSSDLGSVSDTGLFTAQQAGKGVLSVTDGGIAGETGVTVIETPDTLAVKDQKTGKEVTSLTLKPGASVDLTIAASMKQATLLYDDHSAQWSVTGQAGTIDENGVFTAGSREGLVGDIVATVGSKNVKITVKVSGMPEVIQRFEDPSIAASGEGISLALNTDAGAVKFGRGSGRIDYDFGSSGALTLPLHYGVDSPSHMSFWVCGDGSGSVLTVNVTTEEGEVRTLQEEKLDFTGYKQLWRKLFDNTREITSVTLTGSGRGTLYLDQMTAIYGTENDATPPVVTVNKGTGVSGGVLKLSASVLDGGMGLRESTQISVQVDGREIPFRYDSATGALTAEKSVEAGLTHRVTVVAEDAFGNLARASQSIPVKKSAPAFADSGDNWATEYLEYLYDQGIAEGNLTPNGRYFYPGNSITRAEFAKMMATFLELDVEKYRDVALPFADTADIPAWGVDYVKAVYTEGIVAGSSEAGGLYFRPNSSITRADLMTMLGRTLPKGYQGKALSFKDAGQVPGYAAEYVKTLLGLGVVSGYSDNTVRPRTNVLRSEAAAFLSRMK